MKSLLCIYVCVHNINVVYVSWSFVSPVPSCPCLVATCPDLGASIENADVSYSRDPTEQGHYVENTTVTVSCDEGYRGGGDIICQRDGNWSFSSLSICTSEPTATIQSCLLYSGIYVYEGFEISTLVYLKVLELSRNCQNVRS